MKNFKNEDILIYIFVTILVILVTLFGFHFAKTANDPKYKTNKVELTEEIVNLKIAHAVDSVLKLTSKTDVQIIDMILEVPNSNE